MSLGNRGDLGPAPNLPYSTKKPQDRPRSHTLTQHTAKMLQLQLSLDYQGPSEMEQLSTSGAHNLPVPHPHCFPICFTSPEQQLLPRLLFDNVEFIVMSECSWHLLICHVHSVLEEENNLRGGGLSKSRCQQLVWVGLQQGRTWDICRGSCAL